MISRIVLLVGFFLMSLLLIRGKKKLNYASIPSALAIILVAIFMFVYSIPVPPYNDFLALEFIFIPPLIISMCGVKKWNLILLALLAFILIVVLLTPEYTWIGISYVIGGAPLLLTLVTSLPSGRLKKTISFILTLVTLYGYLAISGGMMSVILGIYALPYWIVASGIILFFYGSGKIRPPDIAIEETPAFELKRKFVHVFALLFILIPLLSYPVSALVVSGLKAVGVNPDPLAEYLNNPDILKSNFFLFAISAFVIPMITIEMLRISTTVEFPFYNIVRKHIRKKELEKMLASSDMVIGFMVSAIIMPAKAQIPVILVSVLADAVGALIGKKFGKHLFLSRSFEGCLAEFVLALSLSILFYPLLVSLIVAITFVAIDVLSSIIKINDNLLYPPGIGIIYALSII